MKTRNLSLLGAALAVAVALPAMAQPGPGGGPGGQGGPGGGPGAGPGWGRGAMFQLFDTNGDGRVSFEEGWAVVQQRFAAADTNRDGGLSLEEWQAARLGPNLGRGDREPPREGWRAVRRQEMRARAFRAFDANSDGRVTLEEIRPLAEFRFRMMDANADGAVTREEAPHGRHHGWRHHRDG